MTANWPLAIFFDLDETLITNREDAPALLTRLFQQFPDAMDLSQQPAFGDALLHHAGIMWETMLDSEHEGTDLLETCFESAIQQVGGKTSQSAAMTDCFITLAVDATSISTDTHKLLISLREQGIPLGIVTNGLSVMQQMKIEKHGLQKLVNCVITSERAGAHKPDSGIFEFALEQLGVTPEQAWHVGDHPENDIAGAVRAGLTAVHYTRDRRDTLEIFAHQVEKPDYVIHTLTDIEQLIVKTSG